MSASRAHLSEDGRLRFLCPGCGEVHSIPVGEGDGPRWVLSGDTDRPTLNPSIKISWREPSTVPDEFDDETKDVLRVCHSFVTDGRIQFLADSTHELSGQTVELQEWGE